MSRVYTQFYIYNVVKLPLQLYLCIYVVQDSGSKWFMDLNIINFLSSLKIGCKTIYIRTHIFLSPRFSTCGHV